MSAPILGFFYVIGGKDIPLGYNDNNRFGFDNGESEPVFNYSIRNVKNFFLKPVTCMDVDSEDAGRFQNLIVEESQMPDLRGLSSDEMESQGYNLLLKALNILYSDQETMINSDETYKSHGDKVLSTDITFDEYYLSGSLSISSTIVSTDTRISYVKFMFKIDGTYKEFIIYFVPDIMIYEKCFEIGRYHVTYTTKNKESDLDGLKDILVTGGDSILSMESGRNYTNVCHFDTTFQVISNDDEIVDSYLRRFFIHTHLHSDYVFTNYRKILLIKRWLEYTYSGLRDPLSVLRKEYPELYTENDVDIYPMLTDNVNNRLVSVVRNSLLEEEFERRSITLDINDENVMKKVEICVLEGINKYDNNDQLSTSKANRNFTVPVMVVSQDTTGNSGPISGNFPDYAPLYTGYERNGENWENFHFYMKLFIKLVTGIIPWKYSGYTDEEISNALKLPDSFQLKTDRAIISDVEFINSITFNYLDMTYTIHGFFRYGAIDG